MKNQIELLKPVRDEAARASERKARNLAAVRRYREKQRQHWRAVQLALLKAGAINQRRALSPAKLAKLEREAAAQAAATRLRRSRASTGKDLPVACGRPATEPVQP